MMNNRRRQIERARITFDFDFDPKTAGTKASLDEMRDIIMDDSLCTAIKEACEYEVCDPRIATVSVERLEADLREVEE